MKKRRVLALLLALSLAVSTNGMTVFATEAGEPTASVVSLSEESTEDVQDGAEQTVATDDEADDEQDIDSEDTQKNDESGGEDSDESGKKDADEQNPDIKDAGDETVSDNDLSDEEEPAAEETEELPEVVKNEVRMMTFTDDTGLKITYDANAAEDNAKKVTITDAGVLTEVAADIEGVVDLREKDITEIAENVFKSKTKVTYVMLPKTVRSISTSAFEDCSALKGISIPSRLAVVGNSAFKGCTSLTQLALPNSVTSIGANAFQGDSRLFMVHMVSAEWAKLTMIGANAFEGCSSLEMFCSDETYNLPKSITEIGDSAFKGCAKISKVSMSDQIASLGTGVYQNCTGLKEAALSSGLATIPAQAFEGCTSLERIIFGNANIKVSTTIDGNAFKGCTRLGNIELPSQIVKVCSNAFVGCTALRRIEIVNDRAELEAGAFPDGNAKDGMCIVGRAPSTAQEYAGDTIRFIATNEDGEEFYTYKAYLTGPGTNTDPKITVKVTTVPLPPSTAKDINEIEHGANASKGVAAGTICYFNVVYNGLQGYAPVSGSIKYNGVPMACDKDGIYSFKMPKGGAVITVEFESNVKEVIVDGDEDSIEGRLSAEANYDVKTNTGYLMVGQTAKFYLTNNRNGAESRIPTSKISYGVDTDFAKGVVSIDKSGTIKALKPGNAAVTARVQIANDKYVDKIMYIEVAQIGIDHISMLVPDLDSNNMTLIEEEGKTVGISISSAKVSSKEYQFDLRAIAFSSEEDGDAMESAFTWTSSDTKVAKVGKSSTAAASSTNKITIPKGTDGEATITVTATDTNKKKVSQKFVVIVENYKPRLSVSKITINPNQIDGATKIGIINSYGRKIKPDIVVLDAQTKTKNAKFKFTLVAEESNDLVSTYSVTTTSGELAEKTYSVLLQVEANTQYELPLSITVKKSLPNPTVSFDRKAPKINLFYAKDGTAIQPVISKLGDAVVSGYSLEPLTKEGDKGYKEEDALFLENFQIDPDTGEIKQKAPKLEVYTSNKKPVISGYLVLKFKDYRPDATKRYKITIPTQTVAPSYVLDRTTDTFGNLRDTQEVSLKLLDKKTKQPIAWDDDYTVEVDESTTFMLVTAEKEESEDGCVNIKVKIPPTGPSGKLVMKVSNKKWAEGKEFKFTYNIKIDTKSSKLSLKKSTITLNATYPDSEESFELVSNHRDEEITGIQDFTEQSTTKTAAEYDKLTVSCENGRGTIKLADQGESIKTGNYKYVFTYENQEGKKNNVTLTVKVTKTMPTVTLKGTNAFNLAAKNGDNDYVETSEMTMTVKNLPECQKYVENSTPQPEQPGGNEAGTGGEQGVGEESGSGTGLGDNYLHEAKSASTLAGVSQSINSKFYRLDDSATFDSIEFATKGYEESNPREYFNFVWDEDTEGAGGKIHISLLQQMPVKTYSLKMKPVYKNDENTIRLAKPVTISIKVYSGNISTVKLSAKGKINLLDRSGEVTEKNAIRYTPTVANLKDTLAAVKLYETYPTPDALTDSSKESTLFEVKITSDKKSFYIVPVEGVELYNNKSYTLYVWVEMENYKHLEVLNYGFLCSSPIKIKTAQVLPKVKTDKTAVDLYLSSKGYEATFVVQKTDEKAIGTIKGIAFGEKDEKANNSFDITGYETMDDGSLVVHMKLKSGVSYGCNTTNRITMYIQFKDQGINTAGTPVTMNVKINK